MLQSRSRIHGQAYGHGHPDEHGHGPSSPHPAQAVPWSILRMALVARLGTALAAIVVLWATVLLTTVRW
ncbi:hypothetical protein [Nitrobacter sp.]|uniref:hypothetical protein n=1 Tax=Nitrobacter sp. TaxID=29420 RepID=UPI000E2EAD81|nr:hypothetical protein [Nitrobacter sp.]MCB1393926.1 hypothetical protein [Nitrobacter sp.]